MRKHYPAVISSINNKKYEPWAFYFGGIDCREKIFERSVVERLPVNTIIELVSMKYINFLEILNVVFDICVISAPPQGKKREEGREMFATQEIRQEITAKFNNCVRKCALDRKIKYLDLWGHLGVTKKDLLPDDKFEDGAILKGDYASSMLQRYMERTLS